MELAKKYKTLLSNYGINTPLRLAHFFAQIHAESGLVPQRESLYYTSVDRARLIFKTPFKGKTDAFVSKYLYSTQRMANYVYANRMGNGDEKSGDGFAYRGGGFIQLTAKNNYSQLSKDTGVDYINNPQLIENEADSMIAALWFWKKNNLNKYADQDKLDAISDIINLGRVTPKYGDSNGFEHRKKWLTYYKNIFQ
jgi:putative chitinase